MSNKTPQCSGSACYPNRCPNGQCSLHPAEACTETEDDEQDTGPAARFWTLYLAAVLVACAAGVAGWLR